MKRDDKILTGVFIFAMTAFAVSYGSIVYGVLLLEKSFDVQEPKEDLMQTTHISVYNSSAIYHKYDSTYVDNSTTWNFNNNT